MGRQLVNYQLGIAAQEIGTQAAEAFTAALDGRQSRACQCPRFLGSGPCDHERPADLYPEVIVTPLTELEQAFQDAHAAIEHLRQVIAKYPQG